MLNEQNIRDRIFLLADEDYKKFHSTLVPGEDNILGIRLPLLKGLAKEIAGGDWRSFLKSSPDEYYEDVMLQGLVIGFSKADPREVLEYTARFIPKITNWGVCDSFCTGLKIAKKYPEIFWSFILPYLDSDKEFEIRFAVIMMLAHFITEEYVDEILLRLDRIRHDGYYVKMGVAWAISVCFVKFPEKTMVLLKNSKLDNFTFNKSLQKIIESSRVPAETKAVIKNMKRR